MTEGLFILTVIFAAYVVYQVMNEKKTNAKPSVGEAKPAADTAPAPQPQAAVKPAAAPAPQPAVKQAAASAPKPQPAVKQQAAAAPKPAAPAPKPAAAPVPEAAAKSGLKNPETGEVTAAFTNYRFAKRWIKEALVAEGLLDKVYKNNELDADAEAKIKDAVAKLEALPKYRA